MGEIDEEQEVVDYSDHNLITVTMSMEQKKKEFKKNKWRKGKYYRKDGEVMGEYERGLKERDRDKGEMEIEEICEDMVKEAEIKLKKEFRKKIGTEGKEEIEENEWITEEIRRTIKERREINRKKRNSKEGIERTTLERKWLELKYRVQGQVREEKGKWEVKMTKEIRNCGDRGKKLWQHINRLTGKEKKETEIELYKEGKKMEEKEGGDDFYECWRNIYGGKECMIKDVWDEKTRDDLLKKHEEERKRRWTWRREHVNGK